MQMLPLKSARYLAHAALQEALSPGDWAVDATMGNGHDTLLLAQWVGPSGQVDAFDIQPGALAVTQNRLDAQGLSSHVRLHLAGHETMAEHVRGPVQAVAFNLGWLPGGDKLLTTRVQTTCLAIEAGLGLLAPGGLLSLCVYPGHAEGCLEEAAVRGLLAALPPQRFNVLEQRFLNASQGAPLCFLCQKAL